MDKELVYLRIGQFSELCNWFWLNVVAPDWEPDGLNHTSPECRALALEVMEVLGLDMPTFDDLHSDKTPEEKAQLRLNMLAYTKRVKEAHANHKPDFVH